MARTGRFGRSPRTAPSLTSTIIAIAREFQQQRDTNIMNAWEKGGTFEGKKVTDDLVLAHWRERVNGVSKDDPLHDTYQNAVTQLDYTIHESKMTAAYALSHKTPADDHKMVSFYLGWAKKIPKDSEFYRTLQRDAGQYMRTVRQNGQAAAAAAKEKAYRDQQAETDKKFGAAASFLTDTMRRLNQSGYADGHLAPTLDAPGAGNRNDLTDFDPNDPEQSMKLLALLEPANSAEDPRVGKPGTVDAKASTANPLVLYHSDTIDPKTHQPKPVTGADIIAKLRTLDPSFKPGQPVDVGYLTGLLDRQSLGLQEQIDRATKTGHMTDADQLTKQKGYIATLARQVAAWPVEKSYLDIRDTFDKVANDPTASPMAVEKARAAKDAALASLVKDPRIASNDNFRSRIQDEIDGNTGAPTLKESFTGNGSGGESKDATIMKGQQEQNLKQIEEVNADSVKLPNDPTKKVWTYGKTNQTTGVFTPDANGTEVGTATMADVAGSGMMPQTVTVDDPRGGKGITMVVTAVPVYGKAYDPATGKEVPAQRQDPIAYAYNIPNGGQNNLQYGYLVKDPTDPSKSVMHYSNADNPPWGDQFKATPSSSGGNHFEVDFSALLPTAAAANGAAGSQALNVNLHKAGGVAVTGADGKPVSGFNVDDVGKPTLANPTPTGNLTWDPYTVARTSDIGRNALGGTDPTSDFTSLTVSTLMSSSDGQSIMKTLDQHAEFKQQVTDDGMAYAGAVRDPKTGAWDPTNANVAKLSQAEYQSNMMKNASSVADVVAQAGMAWQRLTTGSPYPANQTPNGSQGLMNNPIGQVTKLATDLVKGTPFEPIAQAFLGGTLTRKPPQQDDAQSRLSLHLGETLKVPTYEPKIVTTTTQQQVGGPGSTTQYQPGSTPPPTSNQQSNYGHGPTAL